MDGIIFDIDGTLWDSTVQVAEAWNTALRERTELGITLDSKELGSLFGKTMSEIGDALFPMLGTPEERCAVLDICYEYENAYLSEHPGLLYEGVRETLPKLAAKYPLFIVSNCQCGYIEVLLESTGLGPYIRDHLCFGETGTPKGQTIRTLMERNGLEDVVYIGDTQGDADACREAGVPFVYAEYGLGNVPDAKVRIRKFSDLESLYL